MSRVVTAIAAGALAMAGAGPAFAADWATSAPPVFKPAYAVDWEEPSPLGFEVGLRYWYGMGGQAVRLQNDLLGDYAAGTVDDSQLLELHGRIDDYSTSTYLRGQFGFSAITEGRYFGADGPDYDDPQYGERFSGGSIAHAGADFGYMPLGNETFRIGGFLGYNYWQDSPDQDREALLGVSGPHIHALRLGIAAEAQFNDLIDFRAEAAAVPWAHASGSTSAFHFPDTDFGNGDTYNRLRGELDGSLYGGMAEAMVGIHPTETFTIRAGLRGWLLTGPATFQLQMDNSNDSSVPTLEAGLTQDVVVSRWGPLIEFTGRF